MTRLELYARLTPYEIGIPGRAFAERAFGAIREEGAGRGIDLSDPAAFLQLGEVGRAIREIQGGERGGAEIERFAAFLFHAFHFHREGERLLLLTEAAARILVEGAWGAPAGRGLGEGEVESGGGAPAGFAGWESKGSVTLPAEAGYLQLPRHLFWSHPDPERPAEPIDGIFWTRSAGDTIALLVAMGIREDRDGISVMELPPLPLAAAVRWLAGGSRDGAKDFATALPGGELGRLYSIMTLGEVLTLLVRAFAHLERHPEALGDEERARPGDAQGGGERVPSASRLPYRRIEGGR